LRIILSEPEALATVSKEDALAKELHGKEQQMHFHREDAKSAK